MSSSGTLQPLLCALGVVGLLSSASPAQVTTCINLAPDGSPGNGGTGGMAISADACWLAFQSLASNLVAGDTNAQDDIFIRARETGITERVSVSSSAAESNGASERPYLSADGRCVVFTSSATNLVAGDTNNHKDVFLRDRLLGTTERVSLTAAGLQPSDDCVGLGVSGDGNSIVFVSKANNIIPGVARSQVYVRDRSLERTICVSVSSEGTAGDDDSSSGSISADGRYIAFDSFAENLAPDTNGNLVDVFLHDRQEHTTELISVDNQGAQVDEWADDPALSADGRFVAFVSVGEFVDVPFPNTANVWVRDLATGVVELGSADADGAQLGQMNPPAISADGRYLVLNSLFGGIPVRLRDRLTGTVEVLSIGTHGELPGLTSVFAWDQCLSADGRFALFGSAAANLVPGDTNGVTDVFLRDRRPFFADLGQGLAGVSGVPALTPSGVLLAGEPVSFALSAANPLATSALFVSPFVVAVPFKGGTLVPAPTLLLPFTTSPAGQAALSLLWPTSLPSDFQLVFQWWIKDAAGPAGFAGSNAVSAITP